MNESDIIKQYFNLNQNYSNGIELGIGDDAAVLTVPTDQQLVVSTDTLVSNVHFFADQKAEDIAYKALAVNLSDMAAMAARPKWVSLSLTMPSIDHSWLKSFSQSFFSLANQYELSLIGGDLSKGSLSITITIQGLVPKDQYISRSGAKIGDKIFVSGMLGDAGLALGLQESNHKNIDSDYLINRLFRPTARVKLGMKLGIIANSMIDVSDGLESDLGHIIHASHVGARVTVDDIPLSRAILNIISHEEALNYAMSSGDDYELCFTAANNYESEIRQISKEINCPITCVGEITGNNEIEFIRSDGSVYLVEQTGYQHFS